jgi:hypothetical protein
MRLDLWGSGCSKNTLSKVEEILEILAGRVSAGLDGIMVLRTMIKWRVLSLKCRATLLCDYLRVEDPTRESSEALNATKVTKRVGGFVSSRTVVTAECVVEAFLVTHQPNLVSCPGLFSFHHSKVVG